MSEVEWICHADAAAMADEVSGRIETVVHETLAGQGQSLVALPGGKSPLPIFARLAERPIRWARVTIVPTDDRLVAASHPLSNAALLKRHFGNTGARIVPLVYGADIDYRAAGDAADAVLRALAWPPDVVWLGVGADGHTASIFPGPDLLAALEGPPAQRALGVLPDPLPVDAPVARVTLTRAAICSARRVLLTLTGDEKRRVVEHALRGSVGAGIDNPIGQVLRRLRAPVEIHWSPA